MTAILPSRRTVAERGGVLGEIAARRRADVAAEFSGRGLADLRRSSAAPDPRDAVGPLLRPGLHLIAELKRRSPSAGTLAPPGTDLVGRARAYQAGGAAVISVLCEPHWFGGSLADLSAVREVVSVPVLAKEFVVDARQLPLLRTAGADLVLLLAALHPARRLRALVRTARSSGLEPLVEAHDRRQLERAIGSGARLIGLNNRDLRTLQVDPERAARLREDVPDDLVVVAESGVREPGTLRDWRALGFDAALVGEALMSAADDSEAIRARTAAFVAAGRPLTASDDPGAASRAPFVKICGLTEIDGALAAVRAGADAIGLNFVPGTPRAIEVAQAARIATAVRAAAAPAPRLVGVFADADAATMNDLADRLGLDAIQLSGDEPLTVLEALTRPAWKVLHLPASADRPEVAAATTVAAANAWRASPGVERVMLDTAGGPFPGGTGQRADAGAVGRVAREIPVTLAGGLSARTVAGVLRTQSLVGVDVASGVEVPRRRGAAGRPRKDPFLVGLFLKRAKAARLDRPHAAIRPTPVDGGLIEVDDRGRWGTERQFGGRYVPETLISALVQLETAYSALRQDPRFWSELRDLRRSYIGGPSALYRADRLAAALERAAGREPGGLRLYLKREDLN
ncbi:MAG: hypothetical protein ACRDQC_07405, partial [Gaiellales bacterium]